ncbi:hypothetical protein FQZ97_985410 [compost metagenome]
MVTGRHKAEDLPSFSEIRQEIGAAHHIGFTRAVEECSARSPATSLEMGIFFEREKEEACVIRPEASRAIADGSVKFLFT